MIFIIYYNLDINKLNNNIRYNNYDIKLINYIKKNCIKNNTNLIIYPILELGDSIAINGGIRYLALKYNKIIYICKKSYYNQISYMYRDLDNIIYCKLPDRYIYQYFYLKLNKNIKDIFKKYNIEYINMHFNMQNSSDEFFTRSMNSLKLNKEIGYKYFKFVRDYNREKQLYNNLVNIIGKKYIIIIDDELRNLTINNKYLKNLKYPIFKISRNSKNNDKRLDLIHSEYVFDYILILENAQKIISIDSSISVIIDMMNINTVTEIYNTRLDNLKYKNKYIKILKITNDDIVKYNYYIVYNLIKKTYNNLY